ncbi:hypothetical protein Tco_0704800 [Tanacetum coccineum]|uniref:Reverse transcriptase domain-containing protein n=1 Tax=Tanacetum coccineum TaxID=301880 RepID=A0ABQ4Y320_9ASTR
MTAKRIDVIDMACEEYSQEVLGFSNVISSGNPTPYFDPIVSNVSPTLTLFGDIDFLLFEEAGSFIVIEDDPNSRKDSFSTCLSHLDKMLKRCEDTNLVLNWEKSHFMVKEGIVLGHKISKSGIEVDRAKVDVIAKLPHPTTVKVPWATKKTSISNHFTMPAKHDEAKAHYTYDPKRLLTVVTLFAKQDAKPRLMRWILLLQEFDVVIRDKKGAENLAADHLSRLENPHQDKLENKEITETFPLETLGSVALRVDSTPWFADFANYHAGNFIVKGMYTITVKKVFQMSNTFLG